MVFCIDFRVSFSSRYMPVQYFPRREIIHPFQPAVWGNSKENKNARLVSYVPGFV